MKKDDYSGHSSNKERHWYKNNNLHREDGPAIEYADGTKYWYLEGDSYFQIVLKDQIILDEYEGKYGLIWVNMV
jgi:hypothetical protein